jgi:hypothetical protein
VVGLDGQRVDAIRTDAIHWDDGARAVWKLQGVDNRSSVVLQGLPSSLLVSILERKTRDRSLLDLCLGVTFVSVCQELILTYLCPHLSMSQETVSKTTM